MPDLELDKWKCEPANSFVGWTVKVVVADKDLVRYANAAREREFRGGKDWFSCLECRETVVLGQRAVLVKDRHGKRRACYCSPLCQTRHYVDVCVKRASRRR